MATVTASLTRKPLFLQAASGDTPVQYDGYMMRLLVGAVWARTGTITNDAFTVAQRAAGANFSVDVSGGYAVLGLTDGTMPDKYLVYQSATINVPLTGFVSAPAAARTHKVFLAIYDKQRASAGTQYDGKIVITEDTGAGAPNPTDAEVVTYLQIATLAVAAGQTTIATANISNAVRHANLGGSHSSITIGAGLIDASATISIASPKAIRSGTTVKLQGGFKRTGSVDFAAATSYNIGTLPAGFAPSTARYQLAPGGSSAGATAYAWRLTISTAGALQADIPTGYTPNWIGLDGVNYEID